MYENSTDVTRILDRIPFTPVKYRSRYPKMDTPEVCAFFTNCLTFYIFY